MPLRLNLLHEVERARAASRRDPLKNSMYILGSIIACFAALYVWEIGRLASIKGDLNAKKAEFEKVDPMAKEATKRLETVAQKIQVSEGLVRRIDGRFYWAPILEQISVLIPREVQLNKLTGSVEGTGLKK